MLNILTFSGRNHATSCLLLDGDSGVNIEMTFWFIASPYEIDNNKVMDL
ncbi:hypothetical protein MNBD_GAMMA14-2102 [hydrothermal vent metagenome]|uniref:Uncharacterized protein n=1 Tax=hydrothermal vent metagenome TaxID=652676 RepID=A0A3B0YAR5_9ZZZZ